MRLGLFGGSFDPVHRGHLALAHACQDQGELDEVWFVPNARQPLKQEGPRATSVDRTAMLEAAIQGNPSWRVCTLELDRGGISYTVETLREIREGLPDAELFFLMGADSLHDLPHWYEPAAILELATPMVVARGGEPEPDFTVLAPLVTPERLAAIRAARVSMPGVAISSSDVRRRLAQGESAAHLVPSAVAEYIAANGLYRGD